MAIINQVRGQGEYDCLLAYSGGKDSTYTLALLRDEYGLRVLAVTFDNGFVSPGAFANIRRVVEALDVDHLFIKPHFGLLRKLFVAASTGEIFSPAALQRASGICNACITLVKNVAWRTAIERR
ncbi:MAG: hypothetical protein HXY24_17640, partial [Rubrivivax sp.]|nr:hypothetical protein [Rubrivivax sp.]